MYTYIYARVYIYLYKYIYMPVCIYECKKKSISSLACLDHRHTAFWDSSSSPRYKGTNSICIPFIYYVDPLLRLNMSIQFGRWCAVVSTPQIQLELVSVAAVVHLWSPNTRNRHAHPQPYILMPAIVYARAQELTRKREGNIGPLNTMESLPQYQDWNAIGRFIKSDKTFWSMSPKFVMNQGRCW